MNFRKAGFVIIGVILLILYVSNNRKIELGDVQTVQVQPISATGGQLQLNIKLKNPNLLSSTIKNVHEKFYVNGVLLGILDNELNQGIPGLRDSDFPTTIRFSNTDYQRAIGNDSLQKTPAQVTVEGDIEYQNLFTSGKIEVHQSIPLTPEHEK